MTHGVDERVLSVKTDGDAVVVVSEPSMTARHETRFDLADPNECRLFLRTINETPDLGSRIALENQHPVVTKAIKNLTSSFGDSNEALIKKDLATINSAGKIYSAYKTVNNAVLAANESAAKRGIEKPTDLKPILTGQRRDDVIAKNLER